MQKPYKTTDIEVWVIAGVETYRMDDQGSPQLPGPFLESNEIQVFDSIDALYAYCEDRYGSPQKPQFRGSHTTFRSFKNEKQKQTYLNIIEVRRTTVVTINLNHQ